jgi:peroxiredoxin
MKFLLTLIIVLNIFSCQEKAMPAIEKQAQEEIVSENKPLPPETPAVSNGIVFRDAQGNLLSESDKDSLVENINLQALRRFDNELNNTEYILFENYEDLRGFVADNVIENLIEESALIKTGGRGAVISKRVVDQWKDQKLPEGIFTMLDGSTKSFKDFEGQLLVLNFWYINCGPCIAEMPYLNNLVETYKDKGVQFLALSFDSIPDITNFLTRTDFTYIQAGIDRAFMYDFTPVSPAHFIVDKDGIIRDILIGAPRNTPEIYDRLVSVIEKNKK